MEENRSALRTEKLSNSNYHAWKQKILLILILKDLDHYLTEDPPGKEGDQMSRSWTLGDQKAHATIGLAIFDEHLEHVRAAESAKGVWEKINNVFECHAFFNRLTEGRRLYTVSMEAGEKVLPYLNPVKHLVATLKSMDVVIDVQEMVMAVLNGVPPTYETLIIALSALGSDGRKFSYDSVKVECCKKNCVRR